MKQMRRLLALLLALCMLFALCACGGGSNDDDDDDDRSSRRSELREGHKKTDEGSTPAVPKSEPTPAVVAPAPPETVTIHAIVPPSWNGPICAWAWSGSQNVFEAWPGEPMQLRGNWYEIEVPVWTSSFIVNGDGGTVQTVDLDIDPGREAWIIVTGGGYDVYTCYNEALANEAAAKGNPLTPDFVVYGLDRFVSVGETASFSTVCYNDASRAITGYFTVTDYETTPYAGGLEWKHIRFNVTFSGSDAEQYGMNFAFVFDDYYSTRLMNDSVTELGDYNYSYQVVWNGERQTVQMNYEVSSPGWVNHSRTYQYDVYYYVPAGYDGVVVGVVRVPDTVSSDYIYDLAAPDTPFFRAD